MIAPPGRLGLSALGHGSDYAYALELKLSSGRQCSCWELTTCWGDNAGRLGPVSEPVYCTRKARTTPAPPLRSLTQL